MKKGMENYVEGNITEKTHTEEHGVRGWEQIPKEQDHWWKSHLPDKQIKKGSLRTGLHSSAGAENW